MKHSISAKLREVGQTERATGLELCHSTFTVAKCSNCGDTRQFPNRCDRFYCPECQPRLARLRTESIQWWIKSVSRPWHVTLTVRNTPDLNKTHLKEMRRWFTNLRHTKFAQFWLGGFYSFEVTKKDAGWHLHIHCIIDARHIDKYKLSSVWRKCTRGFGFIVDAKESRNDSYTKEATKYAAKGNEIASWTGAEISEFIEAFEGTKTFGVFGSLYRKRTEWSAWIASLDSKTRTCECGCADFYFFSEAQWIMQDLRPTGPARAMPPPDLQIEFESL